MAIQNINGIVFTDGSTGKADLSIIEAGVLKNLRASFWGIWAMANPETADTYAGGTAVYKIGLPALSKEYTEANRNDEPDLTGQETITVNIDNLRVVKWEYETLDRARIQNAAQLEALIASHISNSIIAELDAAYIQTIYDYIAADIPNRTILNPTFETATSDGELRTNYFTITDQANKIEGKISKKQLGTDRDEVMVLASLSGYTRLMASAGALGGGNKATDIFVNGNTEASRIAGLTVMKHGLIGKSVPAGVITQDKAYDFTSVKGFVLNTFAIAMPFALQAGSLTANTDPNSGNPKFVMKFAYGRKVIRDDLLFGVRTA